MKSIMKRTVALIAVFTLMISCFTVTAFAMGHKDLYTTGTCYLRADADKESEKLATIKSGVHLESDDYETDGRGVRWYYVYYKGDWGYVSEKNLTEEEDKPTYKKYVVITGSCHVRDEAGLGGESLGTLSEGQWFKCLDAQDDSRPVTWYKIKYKGEYGWVSSKYSRTTNSKPADATAAPTATPKPIDYSKFKTAGYYVTVNAGSVNMRIEPSTSAGIIRAYSYGYSLYAMRTNGTWTEVLDRTTNRSGYIYSDYLDIVDNGYAEGGEVESLYELTKQVPAALLVDAPAGAKNVHYIWQKTADGTRIARICFEAEGVAYTLSAVGCSSLTNRPDIDGENGLIMNTELMESAALHVVTSTDGNTAAAHQYDAEQDTFYSLTGPAVAGGSIVKIMAAKLLGD